MREDELLGRYRLLRRLGRGGMGEVWEARDEELEREVAIKVLSSSLGADPNAQRRFRREAHALARLMHPNIVTIFDVGAVAGDGGREDEELQYLVMELIRGHPLTEELAKGQMAPARAVAIVEQVCRALGAAHATGLVHRDLKPGNVMLGDDGTVKVLDFGLARVFLEEGTAAESLTASGQLLGSYPYMSPEQARGEAVGPEGDVFSCGVMLYEMLSGRRPFAGSDPLAVLRAILDGRYEPIERVATLVTPELSAVVERCLETSPKRRYADGRRLHADLCALAGEPRTISDAPTERIGAPAVEAFQRQRRRRSTRWAAVAAAAAAVGIGAGLLLGRRGMEPLRPDPGRWRARVLAQAAGLLRHPRFHPAGTGIVVERTVGEESEIVLVPLSGGDGQVLTRSAGGEYLSRPAIAPDGKLLAYSVLAPGTQRVAVMPVSGGPPLVVLPDADRPVWFGARRLVFSHFERTMSHLRELDLDASRQVPLDVLPAGVSWWQAEPRPGGGFAALGGEDDVHGRIFVFRGGGEVGVPWTPGGRVDGFAWAGRGASLVALLDGNITRVTSRGVSTLLPMAEALTDPAISPDGTALALARTRDQTDLIEVDPTTGRTTCVLCGVLGAGWGSVGRDGAVVYRRMVGALRSLFVREPSGEERRLTPSDENASCPVFSPDGTRVAYLAKAEDGSDQLRVLSRDGGAPVVLAERVASSEFPSWSPDGRFLTYAAGDPPKAWVVSGGGGKGRVLTPAGGDYPLWSPDGRQIAYVIWTDSSDPNQGVWVVDAAGGHPTRVSPLASKVAWSENGRELLQIRREGGRLQLWSARTGTWSWARGPDIAIGAPPAVHAEHLPVTLDPRSGQPLLIRRTYSSELVVFEGIEPARW